MLLRHVYRSPLSLAVSIISAFLFLGAGGHKGVAQSESRPIYPAVGDPNSANYKWAEVPGSVAVWVFREPVPPAGSGGRLLSDPSEKSQWPDPSGLVGKTSLVLAPHPEYSGDALRTAVEYPVRREGRRLRYLLVIETSRGIYCSRTLGNARGNLPRYHVLSSPAHVRVGKASPEWEEQARALIRRVQQARGRRSALADTTATASSESGSSGADSRASTKEASANSTTSSVSWYNMSLFGWSLGIGLLIVFGVPFLLIYYFTGQASDVERTEVSTNGSDGDDELPPQDLRDANDTLKGAFKAWCVSDRPLISMGSRFEWFVREEHGAEVPLSHWRAQRHDQYVRASPSDATHWAFRSGDAAILFPKPEEDEFASLRGFAGTEVPGELNGIDPAYVSVHGDEAKLQAVGEIR